MTAVASLLVWVLVGVVEDECLDELPGCLSLQRHHVKNKEVWATAKHSSHPQLSTRLIFSYSQSTLLTIPKFGDIETQICQTTKKPGDQRLQGQRHTCAMKP